MCNHGHLLSPLSVRDREREEEDHFHFHSTFIFLILSFNFLSIHFYSPRFSLEILHGLNLVYICLEDA